jgi:Asp-tRNA(Asn)/Glu-tRNA(Gln) amidotransferase A subunit family amidase
MRMPDEFAYMTALELRRLIRGKQVSPVAVVESALRRLEALEPVLNPFVTVTPDLALAAARRAERAVMAGDDHGLLTGLPLSIKDLTAVKGVRFTSGSRTLADFVAPFDSPASESVQAHGATILGKTTTTEFGCKASSSSPLTGITRNPWNLAKTSGGSSAGAAASVAAGITPFALGTDGGGSIRIPSSFCGLFGIKAQFGRVPVFPAAATPTLAHVGPLARTVRDAAAVLDVIAGSDDRDRHSLPGTAGPYLEACDDDVKGLHVAWSADLGYATVAPEVRALCENAAAEFESLGCHVEVVSPGWDSPEGSFTTIMAAQFYAAWADRLPEAEPLMDRSLVKFIRKGGGISAREYLVAWAAAEAYWEDVRGFLERFDLLLTPTVAVAPFPAGQGPPREIGGETVSVLGWMPFTYPFNLTGQPAASVPVGFTEAGLPVGLQIVGRRHADRTVLAAAGAFEAACPWVERHPFL